MTNNIFKSINESWIVVITGPMFCGKTTEMLRIINRYSYAGIKTIAFSSILDTRSNSDFIISRDGYKIKAIKVNHSNEIIDCILKNKIDESFKIIAIDEVQFFDEEIVNVVRKLAKLKFIVICCGLDLDYKGNPFGPMPNLLAVADDVIKLNAICMVCGAPASKTFLLNSKNIKGIKSETNEIIIGDSEKYEARCNKHFNYN